MTSFDSTREIREQGFKPTFKVQEQVYHRISSLQLQTNEEPKFLLIYFIADHEKQVELLSDAIPGIVSQLQDMLHQHYSYVQSLKYAMEKITPELKVVIHADKVPSGEYEEI
ncbi:hypothetical protein AVEN_46866-1 [Araneus ventricosus]|uniref:Uncharacterized protein n=1 Tax=Araneus ventricosus TaxID=182803 RepID=A0A4Y2CN10_ARAVE|nr:hypothetical protein AVEN_46866-1 [Araneus ventricosus]